MSAKIEKLLVALDGSAPSERALDLAVDLAKATGAVIELVTVLDLAHLDPEAGFYLTEQELNKLRTRLSSEILDPAMKHVPAGVETRTTLLEGRIVERLLALIDEEKPSMVLLGRTGKTAFRRMLEGSVSRAVVTHCPVPVTVVG